MIPLFSELTSDETAALRGVMQTHDFAGEARVVREGEAGDRLFIITAGTMAVTKQGADGRAELLAILPPGEVFGEMALLTVAPRSATVVALEPAQALGLAHDAFTAFVQAQPRAGMVIYRALATVLSERLQQATTKLGEWLSPPRRTGAAVPEPSTTEAEASMAEELATPVTVLKGTVDLLHSATLPQARRQEFLRTMTIQASRLVELLKTLQV